MGAILAGIGAGDRTDSEALHNPSPLYSKGEAGLQRRHFEVRVLLFSRKNKEPSPSLSLRVRRKMGKQHAAGVQA
jgi:hypothetical protein